MKDVVTTIKVPRSLRERISHEAARRGITAASLLRELVDRYEREQRLATVGAAYTTPPGTSYADETAAWDEASSDGLAQ